MATWKKVIVSGSNAILNQLNVGTNQQISTSPSTTFLSGSFRGSFSGIFSGSTNLSDLTQGTGIVPFTYDGNTTDTVSVSGASSLNTNAITKWNGAAFANSSLTDNGTVISGSTSIVLTGANSSLTGSFTGSFYGDGSNLTGIASTLHVTGSEGSGSFNLKYQSLTIQGTSNEVTSVVTSGSNGVTVTVGLPDNVTIAGYLSIIGNEIKSSTNVVALSLTGSDVTVHGDLAVLGNDIKSSTGQSVFTLNGDSATANNDLTVLGDLTVAGTASFNNQTSLLIADRFALLASGSSTLTDGGIVVSAGLGYSGSAWYLESSATGDYGRWAVAPNVDATASSATADEYAVTAKLSATSAPVDSVPPTWGGSTNGKGNIWIKEDTGDIYIWA